SDDLLTGADAERAALGYPAGLEVNPKRRIDERVLWLGDRECDIIDQSSRVADYVITFEETLERALGSDESLELIQQIAKEMT
ncbi:hypothetical protein, partial [Micromonospora sp. HM5-17]|uniref:hypothetical protein n=1 Tax=Micromonospora sp. HM5-17 TaxID=2487710 RepID=UPI000FAEBC71